MSLPSRTYELILSLLDPWIFLFTGLSHLPPTILSLVRSRQYAVLLSPQKLRSAWFTAFFVDTVAPGIRANAAANVIPLLEGRTRGGAVVAAVGEGEGKPGLGGVVLELGAGSGNWIDVFANDNEDDDDDEKGGGTEEQGEAGGNEGKGAEGKGRRRKGGRTRITHVYGVEPSPDQNQVLRRRVREAGMEDLYTVVPVGIEHLGDDPDSNNDKKKWDGPAIEKGSVDCIVSILCLCSIPDPERSARELYGYLRKGGRWYVYEHVRNDSVWYMRLYQQFVNLFWPLVLGGCQLCRPTEATIRAAGPWEEVDVGLLPRERWHSSVPHIMGVFTK
ncbi:methyltransferase domain-containing protein [Xylariomycetidae sp. FL2044]|nr:methyltransferase domain-containing protein [Xylariomycetidae sp. FL2044]